MLKLICVASVVALGTFAITVGCGAPSTDGDVKKGGSSAGDDDDNAKPSKGTSSSSGSEVQADCTNLPAADPVPKCDTCAKSKCCKELAACENSNACKAQKKCVEACADGDFACLYGCSASSDTATDLAGEFAGCLNLQCESECAGSKPNLDGGLDPFGDDDDAG